MDYSIIIPAFNEERWLPRTLKSLAAAIPSLPGAGEVIVVDNNSTDRTASVAASHGARVIFEPVNQISRARNTGARAALGRSLIFLDADTTAPAALLREALLALQSGRVAGGGAALIMDRPTGPGGALLVTIWNRLSARLKLAAGSFIYCRRDAFKEIGGFSERVYAGEEIFFSMALKRWAAQRGMAFRVLTSHPVVTSARKFRWFGEMRLLGAALLFLLFPAAIRSRALCGIWYKRPDDSSPRLNPAPHPPPAG